MAITFETAREEQLGAIVGTYNATIPSRLVTADLNPVSVEEKRNWFRGHSVDRRPLWVVKSDGRYAGWMSFSSFYGRPAYDGTVELSVYLEEEMRGRGIGRACLHHAASVAPSLRVHTLLGFIFGHNMASLHLFESEGYKRWGMLPAVASMGGVMEDLVILGKKVERAGESL